MSKSDTPCNMPKCDAPRIARGLCPKHYAWLRSANEDYRAIAERNANPLRASSQRLTRRSETPIPNTPPVPAAAPEPAPEPEVEGDIEGDIEGEDTDSPIDNVIATCCELATTLGIKRIDGAGKTTFVNLATGRGAELLDDGRIYQMELRRV